MKKLTFGLVIIVLIGGLYGYLRMGNQDIPANFQISPEISTYTINATSNQTLEDNRGLGEYLIITDNNRYPFMTFESALEFAEKNGYSKIYFQDNSTLIWEKDKILMSEVALQVPHLLQYPELARGCEVTSLAMVLNYYGYNVSKMELAEEIKKDTTPYLVDEGGKIHYGNPYDGFVGDIYNIKNNGYGVYHGPIAELAREYSRGKVIDMTGARFEDVLYFLERGAPIWVVVNGAFKPLDESEFEIWHTPTNIVKITKRMHSVVVSGYDQEYIYINDPLYNSPNRRINKQEFKSAWEQMGNQAVVIIK